MATLMPPKAPAPAAKAQPAAEFEIVDVETLKVAIEVVAAIEDPADAAEVRQFIVDRALELGLEDELPAEWPEVSGDPAPAA